MYDITFTPCKWEDIAAEVSDNYKNNRIIVDSFWEGHVLEANHYRMSCSGENAGFFAIHGESTIVLFHVYPKYNPCSQLLFERIKRYEKVTNAMLPTGDEFFLSHAADNFVRMEKQAYFSVYRDREPSAKALKDGMTLREVDVNNPDDVAACDLSGDFLKGEIENIRNDNPVLKIYIVTQPNTHAGEVIGFGVIEYGRVVDDIASIGMFVREQYRLQGYASSILYNLKNIVNAKNCEARSGCWYYNHNSKKSMEAAGAIVQTRLLRFYF